MQSDGAIMAVSFDESNWNTRGESVRILDAGPPDPIGGVQLAISNSGNLVYGSGADERQLVIVSPDGKSTPLLAKAGAYSAPRFSLDGRRILFDLSQPNPDIWIFDRSSGTLDRVTNTGQSDRAEWTPDGKAIFFRLSRNGGVSALFSAAVNGSGTIDSMIGFKDGVHEGTLTPDGRTLVFRTATSGGGRDLWSVRLGTGELPKPVLVTAFQELQPTLSPDGQWLAYISDESGTMEVYVRPFPGDGSRVRVSVEGGTEPVWSPDGDRLFYRADRALVSARVSRTAPIAVISRERLFDGDFIVTPPHANYDVGPHGREFVMVAPTSGGTQLVMVLNWFTDVRARLAASRVRP